MISRATPIIAVIGGARVNDATYALARRVGAGIAKGGGILLCGGLGGVMEAASRGAKEAGGLVIGILPGVNTANANAWVDLPIVTGLADARNAIIARTAHALIAVAGEYGTLSEIAFALKFGKPVVSLGSWEIDARIFKMASPEQAVAKAFELSAR